MHTIFHIILIQTDCSDLYFLSTWRRACGHANLHLLIRRFGSHDHNILHIQALLGSQTHSEVSSIFDCSESEYLLNTNFMECLYTEERMGKNLISHRT